MSLLVNAPALKSAHYFIAHLFQVNILLDREREKKNCVPATNIPENSC